MLPRFAGHSGFRALFTRNGHSQYASQSTIPRNFSSESNSCKASSCRPRSNNPKQFSVRAATYELLEML